MTVNQNDAVAAGTGHQQRVCDEARSEALMATFDAIYEALERAQSGGLPAIERDVLVEVHIAIRRLRGLI